MANYSVVTLSNHEVISVEKCYWWMRAIETIGPRFATYAYLEDTHKVCGTPCRYKNVKALKVWRPKGSDEEHVISFSYDDIEDSRSYFVYIRKDE